MESVYAGWLSVLPPVLAIVLALRTKDVIFSLLLGSLSGTILYTMLSGGNLLVAPVEALFSVMIQKTDLYILLFLCLLGGLVQVISRSGAAAAYGRWGSQKLTTRGSALLATSALGCLIFIDDYFNCLTVGTVMRPVTDRQRISRAKLAYIIDSTAAPICIIAPISSWAAAVGSNLRSTGAFTSDFAAFCATIPYNLYALVTLVMVLLLCIKVPDFGPMAAQERRAGEEALPDAEELSETGGRVRDMVLPIIVLIVLAVLGMLYNGGFFTPGACYLSFAGALGNCSAAQALTWAGFGALCFAFVLFVPTKRVNFKSFMEGVSEGIANMMPAVMILVLAWTISGVCRDLLLTADFIRDTMAASTIPAFLLPAIIFVVSAALSFSIGTAWGTFSILIPIVVPVATALSPGLLIVALSATLSGSVFGDHCSPISDTTILSSTGAQCDHMIHVTTQIPYALTAAGCSLLGYLAAGLTDGNLPVTMLVSFGSLVAVMMILCRKYNKEA